MRNGTGSSFGAGQDRDPAEADGEKGPSEGRDPNGDQSTPKTSARPPEDAHEVGPGEPGQVRDRDDQGESHPRQRCR